MVSFECLRKFDDVGVFELLHKHNFATDAIASVLVHKLGLVVDLGRVILPLTLFVGEADNGVGALAQQPAKLVVFVDLIRCAVSGGC